MLAQTSSDTNSNAVMFEKRVVFFVRTFNDIDHMTPLIDRYCQEQQYIVDVFCLNWEYDLFKNPNIKYLQRETNCAISYLWRDKSEVSNIYERIIISLIDVLHWIEDCLDDTKALGQATWIAKKVIKFGLKHSYSGLGVSKVFQQPQPEALFFDYLNASAPRNKKLVKIAKKRGIVTFCLPHGILMYSNKYITKSRKLVVKSDGLYFDYYFAAGLVRSHLEDRGIPMERIIELGSMRYCDVWQKIYRTKIVTDTYQGNSPLNQSCSVVMFLMQSAYNVNDQALLETIECVGEMEGIELVIKPHPRGMDLDAINELSRLHNSIRVLDSCSSLALLEWADVAIAYGSSIALQALTDNKTLIYPTYIDSNTTNFSNWNACWKVDNQTELRSAFMELKNNRRFRPYDEKRVKALISSIVYAGDVEDEVISKHYNFVCNVIEECGQMEVCHQKAVTN